MHTHVYSASYPWHPCEPYPGPGRTYRIRRTVPVPPCALKYIGEYKCWAHTRCVIMYGGTIHKLIGHRINIDIGCQSPCLVLPVSSTNVILCAIPAQPVPCTNALTPIIAFSTHISAIFSFCFWCYSNHYYAFPIITMVVCTYHTGCLVYRYSGSYKYSLHKATFGMLFASAF